MKKLVLNFLFFLVLSFNVNANCTNPIDSIAFKNFKNLVSKHDFDDAKMTEIEQSFGKKCYSSNQVKDLLGILSFEEDKLRMAKKAFAYVSDPVNYLVILSTFNFEASKTEIKQFIEPKK